MVFLNIGILLFIFCKESIIKLLEFSLKKLYEFCILIFSYYRYIYNDKDFDICCRVEFVICCLYCDYKVKVNNIDSYFKVIFIYYLK